MRKENFKEEINVTGNELLAKVKELIEEGKARRIIIKNDKGNVLIEVPLHVGAAVGAAGLIIAPILAAIGAIAALVTNCTIVVVKDENHSVMPNEDEKVENTSNIGDSKEEVNQDSIAKD